MTWRAISRSRRRTRLRTTALPTFLLTVKPTRAAGAWWSAGTWAAWSTKPGMAQRRPAWTRRKSRRSGRRPGRTGATGLGPAGLSRQALAAGAATVGDDLAAAHRGHARPEAVPTLT